MTLYQYPNYLCHHGIKGMKWGIRKKYKLHPRDYKYNKEYSSDEEAIAAKKAKRKKILKIGAAVTVGLLAVYGLYKYSEFVNSSPNGSSLDDSFWLTDPTDIQTKNRLTKMKDSGKLGDAKIHVDPYKGHSYNKSHLYDKELVSSLSPNEHNAIVSYTGNGYHDMNSYLRTGNEVYNKNGNTSKKIKSMTDALEKSSLKEDIVVHRGIGGSLPKMLGVDNSTLKNKEFQQSLRGTVITEKGFFSSGGSMKDAWGGTKIHAKVPKGSKGMYVDPISKFQGEHEFILQRNSSFKIVDYVANGNGTITDVIVELIDQTVK